MTARMMALPSTISAALAIFISSCGGGPSPTAQATPEASSAPGSPPSAPVSSAEKTAAAGAGSAARYDVTFIEQKLAPNPDAFPKVTVDIPGYDQVIPSSNLGASRVRFKVSNFNSQSQGSYVQFILDNQPYTPVTDLSAKVDLTALAPGGKLADGEHILAALVCHKTGESVKHPDSLAVRRFWTGKKTPPAWNSGNGPLMVVGHPYGTYKGDAANDILIDWYLVNMPDPPLSRKGYSIRATLKGPGIKDEGLTRIITEWHTHVIVSAQDGTYTLQMDLNNKNGDPVPGPGNSITRTFNVAH